MHLLREEFLCFSVLSGGVVFFASKSSGGVVWKAGGQECDLTVFVTSFCEQPWELGVEESPVGLWVVPAGFAVSVWLCSSECSLWLQYPGGEAEVARCLRAALVPIGFK